jgi:hypothetical protein
MKKIIIIALSLIIMVGCKKGPKDASMDTSAIETDGATNEPAFDFNGVTAWDFGTITEGERVEHTFKFKNTGKGNLVIASCTASCGCTIPEWPKEAIAPGESGEIKVEFNSAGKSDLVTKDITIMANTNPVKTLLQIKVFVEKKIAE